MNPVKLIADSSCDIGPELAKRYDVAFVPIHVRLNGNEYLDGVNITHTDIYRNYEEKHTLPSTCAMNIGEYEAIFRPYIEDGYDIVHVSLGSGLSSTCNNARLAGELFEPGRVFVIDSKSLSTGSGHIVCECGERIAKGMSQKELSRLSGVSRATIIGLERGDTSNTKMDTLRKIAEPLGLTLDEIFFKFDER